MKTWRIAIARDTAVPCLGFHGLHVACRGLPGVEVTGFFDSKAEDLDAVLRVTGATQHYRDYVQMLDEAKPDIVVLCSRHPHDHWPQIEAAAQRGIHLYCEKPMTVRLEEADAIVEMVERHKIKLCMAHPARYSAGFLHMKEMIEAGAIGRPLTVCGRGKCDHRAGGEDLMVLGTHILDLQTFFFGTPASVWADVSYQDEPVTRGDRLETVEPIGPAAGDDIFACFRFPAGMRGLFESRSQKEHAPFWAVMGIAVVGTEGTLSLRFDDRKDATLRLSPLPCPPDVAASFQEVPVVDKRCIPGAAPLEDSLRGFHTPNAALFLEGNRFAVWDLVQAIEEDRQPVSNPTNARQALEMIYGIYASQVTGSIVRFPLQDRKHPLERK